MSSAERVSRICCICKKLFCCAECRERHEKINHSNRTLNCPFCASEKLPLRVFEDKQLFCHIVIQHLPLYCCLCGEVFKHSKDLETFGTCKWYHCRRQHSFVSDRKSLLLATPSPVATCSEDKAKERSAIDGNFNNNFETLTSPPELYRNTSTPMHVGGAGQKSTFDFKTPSAPNFSLKTPNTDSTASAKSQSRGDKISILKDSDSNSKFVTLSYCSSNHEETPFQSAFQSLSSKSDQFTKSRSGRKLDIMTEQDEEIEKEEMAREPNGIDDMELTEVEGGILPDSQSLETSEKPEKRPDSVKRVRFSDLYENQPEPIPTTTFNMTENDEYFEAQDTLSEIKEFEEKFAETSDIIQRENAQNAEKENVNPSAEKANVNQKAGTSRVVMMVVVENNSGMSDLTPLIDSSLKKLGECVASATARSIANVPLRNSPGTSRNSKVTAVDSYVSVSSVECYPVENSSPTERRSSSSSIESNESTSSGGILSAVAHVVKTAFKSFPGVGSSRNIVREQVPQRENIVPGEASGSGTLSNLASSLLQRPSKRPRDSSENSSPSSRTLEPVVPQADIRSPVAKRHRGWYKIKGREPIARMRQMTSPRGISSETQVFSQGSLSVGDTVLPLPARAHQSTQTE